MIESFKHAVWIFEWVRNGLPCDHSTNEYAYSLKGFIEYCLKLEINLEKAKPLIESGWPTDLPKALDAMLGMVKPGGLLILEETGSGLAFGHLKRGQIYSLQSVVFGCERG